MDSPIGHELTMRCEESTQNVERLCGVVGNQVENPRNALPQEKRRLDQTAEDELTGTQLRVALDNGEIWEGPPSSARLAGR
jgi:hypothetical protein